MLDLKRMLHIMKTRQIVEIPEKLTFPKIQRSHCTATLMFSSAQRLDEKRWSHILLNNIQKSTIVGKYIPKECLWANDVEGKKKPQLLRKSELWIQAEIERGWSQAELPASAAACTVQSVLTAHNKG